MSPTGSPPFRTVRATVDQIEGNTAVLDAEGTAVRIPASWLPDSVREGDGVTVTVGIANDPDTRKALTDSIEARLKALKGNDGTR